MRRPRLAVCETPPDLEVGDAGWQHLVQHVRRLRPDVLVLSEMPFGSWIAGSPDGDASALEASLLAHERGIGRLEEFATPVVFASRPVRGDGRVTNEAFVWVRGRMVPMHSKQHFPQEEGYWEASWFQRGELRYEIVQILGDRVERDRDPLDATGMGAPAEAAGEATTAPEAVATPGPTAAPFQLRAGTLLCTDVWFNEWARRYGRRGADLIVIPRATPPETTERWRTAMRMAALVSGSYVATSNRVGQARGGQRFGGGGWIIGPDGEELAATGPGIPVADAILDPDRARVARAEYPRYVKEAPDDGSGGTAGEGLIPSQPGGPPRDRSGTPTDRSRIP